MSSTALATNARICILCDRCDNSVITQPAAPIRIGGLAGSENIAQDAQWANICTDCVRENNRVLDAAYVAATSPRQRRAAKRMCAPRRYLP